MYTQYDKTNFGTWIFFGDKIAHFGRVVSCENSFRDDLFYKYARDLTGMLVISSHNR